MLHKIIETGQTDGKCNILLKYSCMHVNKIFFSFFTKLDILITTIRIISIGTAMLVTIFGIESVMIKKNFSFNSKDQGKHLYKYFISKC